MINPISFLGTTKTRIMTDPHLNTVNTRRIMTRIDEESQDNKNKMLFLNGGDLFKGVYPREIEKASYLKLKEKNPNIKMVFTIGNNDFGFNKDDLNYLIDSVNEFKEAGIETVCSNIFEGDSNKRPDWLKPYTIVERDGDRTFIAGFCTKNINVGKYGLTPKTQTDIVPELAEAIKKEKPDNIVILNHDFKPTSNAILKAFENEGVKVDAIYGGHDHDRVEPDLENHIFYPQAFGDTMYEMDMVHDKGITTLENIMEVYSQSLKTSPDFKKGLPEYEQQAGLYNVIAPYTLKLDKEYSKPCPLGSFLADGIKEKTNADIAFFSTGFLMKGLSYKEGKNITRYDFLRNMATTSPIQMVELSSSDIKDVFQHALNNYDNGESNAKFIQASNNIKVEGRKNEETKTWEVKQIYINDKALLDDKKEPLDKDKKFSCAVDSYLAAGGQNYTMLKDKEKTDLNSEGKPTLDQEEIKNNPLRINELLEDLLIEAPKKYEKGSEYPNYKIETV